MSNNILTGLAQLIESPSGIFSLISLAVIAAVTWHQPSIGSGAFIAFFGIVPAALGYFEHKETLAQMGMSVPSPAESNSTIPPAPLLPPRGTL